MSTTTAHFSWVTDNTSGNVSYTVKYRLTGTSLYTQFSTSGTTAAISGLYVNRIYDFQVINVNNDTNPASPLSQGINITDPNPVFSPVNTSIAYTFPNLSIDMDTYTSTIATVAAPGVVIATHVLPAVDTITDTFTGLSPLTSYLVTITPAANEFYKTFTYTVTTEAVATCPSPTNTSATIS